MLIFELSTNFHFLGNIWSLYPQLFKLNHLRNCKQLKCKSGNYNQLKHAFIVDQVPQHCTQVIYFHCFYRCSASIQHSSALNKPDLSLNVLSFLIRQYTETSPPCPLTRKQIITAHGGAGPMTFTQVISGKVCQSRQFPARVRSLRLPHHHILWDLLWPPPLTSRLNNWLMLLVRWEASQAWFHPLYKSLPGTYAQAHTQTHANRQILTKMVPIEG